MPVTISTVRNGAHKPNDNPYTIVIVASPAIESPVSSGNFVADPIIQSEGTFNHSVQYVIDSVFGHLPLQAETFMEQFESGIRVISIFDDGLAPSDATSLVAEWNPDDIIGPRQAQFAAHLARYSLNGRLVRADVAFAITSSPTHTRSSAQYTFDDDGAPGIPFTLGSANLVHRFTNIHPGAVALHSTAYSVIALHEFGHAASSWTNGSVEDLYVDSDLALNVKRGRPIPAQFATMDGASFAADPRRDGLGYPSNWSSYHCAPVNAVIPAVMDDFWLAKTRPEDCKHDHITVTFLADRIRAIMSRP